MSSNRYHANHCTGCNGFDKAGQHCRPILPDDYGKYRDLGYLFGHRERNIAAKKIVEEAQRGDGDVQAKYVEVEHVVDGAVVKVTGAHCRRYRIPNLDVGYLCNSCRNRASRGLLSPLLTAARAEKEKKVTSEAVASAHAAVAKAEPFVQSIVDKLESSVAAEKGGARASDDDSSSSSSSDSDADDDEHPIGDVASDVIDLALRARLLADAFGRLKTALPAPQSRRLSAESHKKTIGRRAKLLMCFLCVFFPNVDEIMLLAAELGSSLRLREKTGSVLPWTDDDWDELRFDGDMTISELARLNAKLLEKNIDRAALAACVKRWRREKKKAGELFMLRSLPMTREEEEAGMRSCGVYEPRKELEAHFAELSKIAKSNKKVRSVLDDYKSGSRKLVVRISGDGKMVG